MKPAVSLAALVCWLASVPAAADAVVVTRAMTASTIMEAFVEDDGIVVELEIGSTDTEALQPLLDENLAVHSTLPAEAGLSIRADGRLLRGTLEGRVRRRRIERDEISGEPLPKPGTEDVTFVELHYPLRTRPRELVIEPPITGERYAAVDIGFVLYHRGVAINDFRYLAVGELVLLDWEDPFYSRFERRTLNRKYGSPMNVFLYVEPFEVRKEFVVRPLDLARFGDIDVRPHEPIPREKRRALLDAIAELLRSHVPVIIDGETPEPVLDRIHFLKRGLRMTRVVGADEPIDGTSAMVGAIFVYPVDGMPSEVRLTWDLFDERVTRVPAAATDEAGPMPYFLTPDDAELEWNNYLKASALPGNLEVRALQARVAVPAALAAAVPIAIALLFIAVRRRTWQLGAAAALVAAAGWALPLGAFEVVLPPSVRAPSAEEAAPTIHALLHNAYRALDFRDEEVVFDRLAQSLSGDVLERVYLEMRKGLRLENQGGARVRVREVRITDVIPKEEAAPGAFLYETRWQVTGSVGHWGHTHLRTNSYDALVELSEIDGRWKIADIEILEEQRVVHGGIPGPQSPAICQESPLPALKPPLGRLGAANCLPI